jgi:hypothetical protein
LAKSCTKENKGEKKKTTSHPPLTHHPWDPKKEKNLFSKCFFLNRNDTFDDIPKTDVPMTPAPQKTTPHTQPKTPTPQKTTPKKKKKEKKERKKERKRKRERERERGPH